MFKYISLWTTVQCKLYCSFFMPQRIGNPEELPFAFRRSLKNCGPADCG
jgi:hypothetical protein